ncbi:hypothetical protein JQ616_29460 [Bradyrhizobium tropiciagri]|uniref:hypothetical protein n=1 Tax=Bradyrhizobium tropiciagri TaxID=312253 RepID=UPI001BAB83DE|nr:hypothetical protein [Bradyrhizobium tropiciagri]MBR0899100.1 hypothetical protein [Bradyrhizobium tropiciagri]
MSVACDALKAALNAACEEGVVTTPQRLLETAVRLADPLQALVDWDRAEELFAVFAEEYPFLRRMHYANVAPTQDEAARYADVIRWLMRSLRNWSGTAEAAQADLAAIIVVAQTCDVDGVLWQLLPEDIGRNTNLIDVLKRLVASFGLTITAGPGSARDTEALARFIEADAQGDWVTISQMWSSLRRVPFFPNAVQAASVRCLNRFAPERLAEGLRDVRQSILALQLVSALSVEDRLRVAMATDNGHLELAAVQQTVAPWQGSSPDLTAAETQLLTEQLLKVMLDPKRWTAWMKIFNHYPARFPTLQVSLGEALAGGSADGLQAYVDAIWLYAKPPGQAAGTAQCLGVFREHASLECRQALWTAAHERWLAWDFGASDPNEHLARIVCTDLDYAVISYATECMAEFERTEMIQRVRERLLTIDHDWYETEVELMSAWYRQLSKLQPYAAAARFLRGESEWNADGQPSWPFDPERARYAAIKYRASI